MIVALEQMQTGQTARPGSRSLEGRLRSRCDHGDTAAGIPILEKKLQNGGFTLPPRLGRR